MSRPSPSCRRRIAPVALAALSLLAIAPTAFAQSAADVPSSVGPGTMSAGDTAWMMMAAALVMLMVPGLALFYAGMVRRKNVLGTMLHSLAALGIVGIEWIIVGYAMAFGQSRGHVIGWDPRLIFLHGIRPDMLHAGTNIPELVFVMFQGMFAIITPALIAGAFAERVKFSSYALFTLLWSIFIYNPLAHWVWAPGGWLGTQGGIGAIDFAGGTVVHVAAGASALVMALYLGKRIGYPQHVLQPNSLTLTLLGTGLLWFGWFGFNAGSAGAANGTAALAFTTTQIAAAAGGVAWLCAEWWKHGRPTGLGLASGFVAGLVAITPASGFVPPWAALPIGAAAGLICYAAVLLKGRLGYDDSLDAFGVHGVGGFLGALLTGCFCSLAFNAQGAAAGLSQFGKQFIAASAAAVFAGVGTLILVVVLDKLLGFRLSRNDEIEGLDAAIHGEQGWMLEQMPEPAVAIPGDQPVDSRPLPPLAPPAPHTPTKSALPTNGSIGYHPPTTTPPTTPTSAPVATKH